MPGKILLPSPWSLGHFKRTCQTGRPHQQLVVKASDRLWDPPPAAFDFRAESSRATADFVYRKHPGLKPLLDQGALLVIPRPAGYVERREDGYQEPEEVVLVGTAHVSEQSAEAVAQVIQAVRPDNVVVELCRSRSSIMQEDTPATQEALKKSSMGAAPNPLGLRWAQVCLSSGGSLPEALLRSVRLGGGTQVILRAAVAGQAAKVAQSVGLATGAEMRAARRAAEQVGAVLVLGDRPIEVTLQRTWQALTWRQKLQLGGMFLRAAFTRVHVDAQTVEALKTDESAAAFSAMLSSQFPKVAGPLLHERDAYLAWCLKRSKAVSGARCVVGVIGFGHLRGVAWHLMQESSQLRFRDLAGLTGTQKETSKEGQLGEALLTGVGIASSIWWVSSLFAHG